MHESYEDIRHRIAEPPHWFDEVACPRYVPFHPSALANIYAEEAAMVLITCQGCGKEYRVAFSFGTQEKMEAAERRFISAVLGVTDETVVNGVGIRAMHKAAYEKVWQNTLADLIRAKAIHFGDPPNACPENCASGGAMNSEPRRVLEYWRRYRKDAEGRLASLDWERDPSLEIDITPDWVREGSHA